MKPVLERKTSRNTFNIQKQSLSIVFNSLAFTLAVVCKLMQWMKAFHAPSSWRHSQDRGVAFHFGRCKHTKNVSCTLYTVVLLLCSLHFTLKNISHRLSFSRYLKQSRAYKSNWVPAHKQLLFNFQFLPNNQQNTPITPGLFLQIFHWVPGHHVPLLLTHDPFFLVPSHFYNPQHLNFSGAQ